MAKPGTTAGPGGNNGETGASFSELDAGSSGAADVLGDGGEGTGAAPDKLAQLLEQYGAADGGYRVYIERVEPVTSAGYLGPVPLDEELLAAVKSRWGGGRYGGRIVDSRGKYITRLPQFKIAGKSRDDDSEADEPAQRAAANHDPEQLAALVARTVADAVRASLPAPPAPADPLAQLTGLASLLKELRPAPVAAVDHAGMFETFSSMLDLRDRLTGAGGGGDSGVTTAIKEFAPLIRNVLAGQGGETSEADAVRIPRFRRPAAHQEPATTPVASWLSPFIGYKSLLLSLADQGKDPALYGDVLVDNLSNDQAAAIAGADRAGTLETDLFAAVPELSQSAERRTFAGRLLAELRAGLYGEASPPAETPPPAAPPKKTSTKKRAAAAAGGRNG